MRRHLAWAFAALAALVSASDTVLAQRNAVDPRSSSVRELGRSAEVPAEAGNTTLQALDRILASSKLSAFDRSIYLSIRAYQLTRLGRDADGRKDIAEMGRVLPTTWQLVLSGTVPELAGGGDRAAALRTLDSALQHKPGDSSLVVAQAQVHMQIAEFGRARDLLDAALASAPSQVDRRTVLFYRGHAEFNLGRYAQAEEDFASTLRGLTAVKSRLGPLVWHYAAQVRARRDARGTLAREIGGEALEEWPEPIVRFLVGRLPAGELEVIAETDDAAKRSNGKCPSAFFIAMDALRRGDRPGARTQLQLAQARCPTISEFNWAAASELKRL